MRRTLVLLAAAGLVATGAVQSSAQEIPPPVDVETDGTCGDDYRAVLRAGNVVVCVVNIDPPSVRVTFNGCGAGEWPVLVDDKYGVCVS